MQWKDATQIRVGVEYMATNNLALRGGYYYDPSPAPNKTMNVLVPSYDFNAISFGLGYKLNGLTIDVAVEYLIGKDRDVGLTEVIGRAMFGMYTMKILAPGISISYGW